MARSLVGSGLMPSIGVFHKNRSNAFPLADDMMEPYRPFVDERVFELCEEGLFELTTKTKARLLDVLSTDTYFKDVIRPLAIGLSFSTSSLVNYYNKGTQKLNLPTLE